MHMYYICCYNFSTEPGTKTNPSMLTTSQLLSQQRCKTSRLLFMELWIKSFCFSLSESAKPTLSARPRRHVNWPYVNSRMWGFPRMTWLPARPPNEALVTYTVGRVCQPAVQLLAHFGSNGAGFCPTVVFVYPQ